LAARLGYETSIDMKSIRSLHTSSMGLLILHALLPSYLLANDKGCTVMAFAEIIRADDSVEELAGSPFPGPVVTLNGNDLVRVTIETNLAGCTSIYARVRKNNLPDTTFLVNDYSQSFFRSGAGAYSVEFTYPIGTIVDVEQPAYFTIGNYPTISITAGVWLFGAYDPNSTLMRDDLRASGLLGSSPLLSVTGNDAIVDAVTIEFRDQSSPSTILVSLSLRVQRDGDIVTADGNPIITAILPSAPYYVSIRHRNHLGAMTATAHNLTNSPTTFDFRSSTLPLWGTNATRSAFSTRLLWAGNSNEPYSWSTDLGWGQWGTRAIKYTGADNDRDPILTRIGGTIPTSTMNGYYNEDVNMDGVVKYTGANNDRDIILQTIGGTVPTAVRLEQLP
jgi:hypothetical protein